MYAAHEIMVPGIVGFIVGITVAFFAFWPKNLFHRWLQRRKGA